MQFARPSTHQPLTTTCLVIDANQPRGQALARLFSETSTTVVGAQQVHLLPPYPTLVVWVEPVSAADVWALCTRCAELKPEVEVVVVLHQAQVPADFFSTGAADIVRLSSSHGALATQVLDGHHERTNNRTIARQRAQLSEERALLFYGQSMRQTLQVAHRVARTEASVLLSGGTGTGKELLARAIHLASPRADGPFVAVNLSALPAGLVEAELFGHSIGAFTGASHEREGRVEMAAKGTLFLDEVGELPLQVQVKLLRLLQERSFERLGEGQTRRADFRLISATHRDLEALVDAGSFREDLFYRINVVSIALPPLRDRGDDVATLARHFVEQQALKASRPLTLTTEALQELQRHTWPGNIRELKHAVERAVVMVDEAGVIGPELVRQRVKPTPLSAVMGDIINRRRGLDAVIHELEGQLIAETLAVCDGDRSQAAALLGLSRQTLWNRLRRHARSQHPHRSG